jgi:hypothetical protein
MDAQEAIEECKKEKLKGNIIPVDKDYTYADLVTTLKSFKQHVETYSTDHIPQNKYLRI